MFHIFSMQIPVRFCTVQIALCTLEVSSRQFPMHFLLDQSDLCMGDLWCLAKWISSLHRSFDIFCLAQSECYVYALSTSTLEITVGQIGFRIMLHVLQCCLPYVGLLLQYISVRVQVFRASLWWLDHCVSLSYADLLHYECLTTSSIALNPVPYLWVTVSTTLLPVICSAFWVSWTI